MIKTAFLLLFLLSFAPVSQAQEDCIQLNFKGSKKLKEIVRRYMVDSLSISKIKISDPGFSPYEKDYPFVQENRDNCDSLVHIPIYYLRAENRGQEDVFEFMLDAKGAIVIVIRENSDWYREY